MVILSLPTGPLGGGSGTRSYFVRRYWSTLTGLSPAGLGYCRYCTTHIRPRSSNEILTGCRIIGSAAASFTSSPSAGLRRLTVSSGDKPAATTGRIKKRRRATEAQRHRGVLRLPRRAANKNR